MVDLNSTLPSLSGRLAVVVGELSRSSRSIAAAIAELDKVSGALKADSSSSLTSAEYHDSVLRLLSRADISQDEMRFISRVIASGFGFGVEVLACSTMVAHCLGRVREAS